MNKTAFKVGEVFRTCENRNAWVPVYKRRCDECNAEMPTGTFTVVTQEMLAEATDMSKETKSAQEVSATEEHMECIKCKKMFPLGESTCACGGSLRYVAARDDSTLPKAKKTMKISVSQVEELQTQEAATEVTRFYYSATRFENGRLVQARQQRMFFEPGQTVFGRYTFLKDARLFFDQYSLEDEERYCTISSENVYFFCEKEQLFVQLISAEKSDVVINNRKALCPGEKVELHEGDCLRFGGGAMDERCIDIVIHKQKNGKDVSAAVYAADDFQKQIMEKLDALERKSNERERQLNEISNMGRLGLERSEATLEKLDDVLNGIQAFSEKANGVTREELERLIVTEKEEGSAFDTLLHSLLPSDEEVSEEEKLQLIKKFLKIPDKGGNTKECHRHFEAIAAQKQIVEYLYEAAFLENVCNLARERTKGDLEDYSPAANLIGKAFEEFVCVEVKRLVLCNDQNRSMFESANGGDMSGYIPQGRIARFLRVNNGKAGRIKNLFRTLGYNPNNQQMIGELDGALVNIADAIEFRNDGSHASASKMDGDIVAYFQKNEVKKGMSYDYYMKKKYEIFSKQGMDVVHKYFKKSLNLSRK